MESPSTPKMMNKVAFMKMSLAPHDIAQRLIRIRCRSLQRWHRQRCVHRLRLVRTETRKEVHVDGVMVIMLTMPTRTMAISTKMNTTKDIRSIRTSRLSSLESRSLHKTTFSKSSKLKFVEVGKFQNADLAQNVRLPTVITNY